MLTKVEEAPNGAATAAKPEVDEEATAAEAAEGDAAGAKGAEGKVEDEDPGPIFTDPDMSRRIMAQFHLAYELKDMQDWLGRVRHTIDEFTKEGRVSEIRQDIMESYACRICQNDNPARFRKEGGNVICLGKDDATGCGTVVLEHYATEGDDRRTHAEDPETQQRVHRGSAPNPLLSASSNMATVLKGEGKMHKIAREVQMTHDANERVTAKDTRTSTKDQHKKEAWKMMDQIGTQLNLSYRALQGAKERFAFYRDAKQHVNSKEVVIAICMLDGIHAARDGAKPLFFTCPNCQLKFNNRRDFKLHNCQGGDGSLNRRGAKAGMSTFEEGKEPARWGVREVAHWAQSAAKNQGIKPSDVEVPLRHLIANVDPRRRSNGGGNGSDLRQKTALAKASFLNMGKKRRRPGVNGLSGVGARGVRTAGQRLVQAGRREADMARLLGLGREDNRSANERALVKALTASMLQLTKRAKRTAAERERAVAEQRRINIEDARNGRHLNKRRKLSEELKRETGNGRVVNVD